MKISKGFTAIEGLLILVIVGILGFTGYYVYNSHKKTEDTLTEAAAVNQVAQTTKKSNSIDQTNATKLVTEFYNKYSAVASTGLTDNLRPVVQTYGTAALLAYYDKEREAVPRDPILCAQNTPEKIIVTAKTSDSQSATVLVDDFGPDNIITVKVVDQGGLKVDSITCPSS
jgi:Tfp pilus assembly protein PilE